MNEAPTLEELRDLHRRCTHTVIKPLFKGEVHPYGWFLYHHDGKPGTHPVPVDDQVSIFAKREDESPESFVIAMAVLVRKYLVSGGAGRAKLAEQGVPLPRAIILIAPPHRLVEGEFVKSFVLTEHQTYLADSPVVDGGKAVRLADLELLPVSLTHNKQSGALH